jgi:hypothetical protein
MKKCCNKSLTLLIVFSRISPSHPFSPNLGKNSLCCQTIRKNAMHPDDQELVTYPSANSIASFFLASLISLSMPFPAVSAPLLSNQQQEGQGLTAVTQSELGKSVRRTIVGGAQIADTLDMKWERFSDSLRDEKKCDPRTNRRMFDNGFRKDGTRIGNPVLGALCTPEPLKPFDTKVARSLLELAQGAATTTVGINRQELQNKEDQVKELVGPAFSRGATKSATAEKEQELKRQDFNRDLYTQMRAYGEIITQRSAARTLEITWGNKILAEFAPNANRNDYNSPFPKPDSTDDQTYDEGALLDALGGVSVALQKMQEGGLIGHWEISIPEDDFWNVVTIAVDDDISIDGQILARERNQPLSGSAVVAVVRANMEAKAKIPYKIDTFFIDPTTTRQELYNPTQLLISLSDLGQ